MEVKAKAKFIRLSPRKARLVINTVRGLDVEDALTKLAFLSKKAAQPVSKLIKSAIANAEHNAHLRKNNLYIKEVRADMGPMLKRMTPKAYGRAALIRKRMSHISVVLAERVATKAKKVKDGESESTLVVPTNTENAARK